MTLFSQKNSKQELHNIMEEMVNQIGQNRPDVYNQKTKVLYLNYDQREEELG